MIKLNEEELPEQNKRMFVTDEMIEAARDCWVFHDIKAAVALAGMILGKKDVPAYSGYLKNKK